MWYMVNRNIIIYCEHFLIIETIINQFYKEDAIPMAKCQRLLIGSEGTLKNKLIYIKSNFSSLSVTTYLLTITS